MSEVPTESLQEGRFTRFSAIQWWDQALISNARVLVVGAGALGNEVIKNLSLLGVGNLAIVDMDSVELSNLSRSILFREEDRGKPKAECAARAARLIYPDISVEPIVGNVLADVGLGRFRWAQVVVGALDNREARVFVNSICARVGRPWIDGGLDVLQGIARGFAPPETACYECTMSEIDWDLLNRRRSCSLFARRALEQRGTPTTPTIASIIGGIQAQEVIKLLHGMDALVGRGFVFEGTTHSSYTVSYQISPDCRWHDTQPTIEAMPDVNSGTRLKEIWDRASKILRGVDAIDLGREMVSSLECTQCGVGQTVMLAVEKISEQSAVCPSCGSECHPRFFHSVTADSDLLDKTIAELGLPKREIVWARRGADSLGIEIAGDTLG